MKIFFNTYKPKGKMAEELYEIAEKIDMKKLAAIRLEALKRI